MAGYRGLLFSNRKDRVDEFLSWLSNQLIGRIDGPLRFRLILQPAMAILFAIRDGLNDARRDRVPYLWGIFTEPSHRAELFLEGWKAETRVFLFAAAMDLVYQYLALGWLYPLAAVSIAFLLAFLPYLLIRGPVHRISRALKNVRNRGPRRE